MTAPSPSSTRKQKTPSKILSAATRVLAKNPKASMNDIADAADVGRATLFRHFKTRKQLLRNLAEEAVKQINGATRPIFDQHLGSRETLEQIIRVLVPLGASFHFLSANPILADTLESEGLFGVDAIYDKQMGVINELSHRLKHDGIVAPEIPLAWIAAVLDNLIYTAWVTISNGDIAPNDAPGLVLSTFLRGLSPT